jgi:hypothetical protein
MISNKALKNLVIQKLKDADVLAPNRRYATAVYIVGYALELALKLKICRIFKFVHGFPEDKAEFIAYQNSAGSGTLLSGAITQVRDIRNHDLNKLLFYSGTEYPVKLYLLNEWGLVSGWDPEIRYKVQKVLKRDAVSNIAAVKKLIQTIL